MGQKRRRVYAGGGMDIEVLVVPYDSGHRGRRMGAGPGRLLEGGLADGLMEAGHDVRVTWVELEMELPTETAGAFQLAGALRDRVAGARREGRFPLVLSGNCISAVGTVAALGRPDVYWFDAHGDLNTPETTRSGFLDGMTLSILLGRCWAGMRRQVGLEAIPEERVWLVAARDLDSGEEAFLERSRVRRIAGGASPDDIAPAAGSEPGLTAPPAYLHIDLDALDVSVGRANAYAAPGGLGVDDVAAVIDVVRARKEIGAAALTAYDPAADPGGAIIRAAAAIVERVVAP